MGLLSSDLEVTASHTALDDTAGGTLVFQQDTLSFYPNFTTSDELHIPTNAITDFSLRADDNRDQRLTVTRLFFLHWLAFALPKKTGDVTTTITVQTDASQDSFRINDYDIEKIEQAIRPYLDAWGIMLN